MAEITVWTSGSAGETRALAEALGRCAAAGDIVLLEGPLGAGKTCFAQGLARGLDVSTPVKSPTFVLVSQHRGRIPLTHVDLYRVCDKGSLDDLGLEEQADATVLAVEWGEKLEGRIEEGLVVALAESGPERRRLVARALGPRGREWLEAWARACPPSLPMVRGSGR